MKNMERQRVPAVKFRTRVNDQWVDVTSAELFEGRNVIVFSLPGAFTPTCSSSHVPRFNQLASWFKAHGIDEVVCISVNDAFVMQAWQDAQKASDIRFIPDGNGEFTAGIGMLVDKSELGFGKRSWRYSMLVRDGIIEKMFVEAEEPGDPFKVSDADTMRRYLAPNDEAPADVTIFARPGCSHCERAKRLLREAGLQFDELLLNRDYSFRTLAAVSGARTFPQVFVNGELVGGAEALEQWLGRRAAA